MLGSSLYFIDGTIVSIYKVTALGSLGGYFHRSDDGKHEESLFEVKFFLDHIMDLNFFHMMIFKMKKYMACLMN